ncbi:MAG: nucleotidyltransferase domain-containing protein [Gammaproteobacteria bacterium]|nr:nucleotidyltransferase domain-containing protein [Gammaproteobacteria bacterium]
MNARDSEKPDLLDFLHVHRDRINALGVQYGARRIRVFGSVARREEGPESDVDFLVDFPRGYDMLTQRLALVGELERLLARNVEVIPEHELNRHLKERVIGEAIEL